MYVVQISNTEWVETEYNKAVMASFISSDWQSLAATIYLRVD